MVLQKLAENSVTLSFIKYFQRRKCRCQRIGGRAADHINTRRTTVMIGSGKTKLYAPQCNLAKRIDRPIVPTAVSHFTHARNRKRSSLVSLASATMSRPAKGVLSASSRTR